MCWATTIGQGKLSDNVGRMSSNVRGPPVETPISTSPAIAWLVVAGFGREADSILLRAALAMALAILGRARVAAATLARISPEMTSISNDTVPPGFSTKSTAPSASASSVACAPRWVMEDTITTGRGQRVMMCDRQVSPSISGILTSSVTTSGLKRSICTSASAPLRAVCTS